MRPNNRAGSHNLPTLMTMLSERDREILRLVWQHRFLTTRHIQRLLFWDHATTDAGTRACVRVLTRLRQHRFLHRLERPIGGVRGGSGAFVWCVGAAGDRVMRADPDTPGSARTRPFEPTPMFLNHTLAIAETRVRLQEAAHRGHIELLAVETEPANWRTFTAPDGTAQVVKPDLRVTTAVGDFEDHWFLEVDLGTESIPVLIRKCLVYQRYKDSGREQARLGLFPAVVLLIGQETRRKRLEAAIQADTRLDGRVFQVVEPGDLERLIRQTEEPDLPTGVAPLT